MTLAAKQRLLVLALALSFAWPLAHVALVRIYAVNPWSWWGWAMYTKPPPRISTLAFSTDTGRPFDVRRLAPEAALRVRAAYESFSLERMAYGALREPTAFARELLRAFPDERGVRVEVQRIELDRESCMLVIADSTPYTYAREELGE